GSGTVSPRHPGIYGATHGTPGTANYSAGYSASPRVAPHQPNTGATMGSAASVGAGSGGGRYAQQPQRGYAQQQGGGSYAAQRGHAQQQGGGGYAQRSVQQHGYSAVPGSPSSVGSGGGGNYSATLQRGGVQSGSGGGGYSGALQRGGVQSGSGVGGYSGVQRAGSHLAPPKVAGVVRPSGIGMGASKRPGYGAVGSGPGVVPGATGSPRIGPTYATTTSASSANSSSIPTAPRTDAPRHQTSIPRLSIPGPSSSSHSRTSSFNTCPDPSSATAAAAATAAVPAPASAPFAAVDNGDAASAPYADSAAAVGDVGPDHASQGIPRAPSEPDHQPQPQPLPAGAAVVETEDVESEAASKADAAAAPPATPTISNASGSTSSRVHKGPSLIPIPPITNEAGGGLGSGVGSAIPRHLQRSNTLATPGGSVSDGWRA
ncbi:hypothetical protein DUNSADRAFT_7300, partial [Dunaliella salina]